MMTNDEILMVVSLCIVCYLFGRLHESIISFRKYLQEQVEKDS